MPTAQLSESEWEHTHVTAILNKSAGGFSPTGWMDQFSMNTRGGNWSVLKDKTETFDEIMVRARRLARGMGVSFMYGDGSKLHYRVRTDRHTGTPVNEGFVAYDPRPRQP